jgi:hypothetical protein
VLADCARPRKRHVHQRTTSGNTNRETVATAGAHTTPAEKRFLCVAIYVLLENYPSTVTGKYKLPVKTHLYQEVLKSNT